MKINFEDGSFICFNNSTRNDKVLNITMCGINGKRTVMSASELSYDEVKQLITTLQDILLETASQSAE